MEITTQKNNGATALAGSTSRLLRSSRIASPIARAKGIFSTKGKVNSKSLSRTHEGEVNVDNTPKPKKARVLQDATDNISEKQDQTFPVGFQICKLFGRDLHIGHVVFGPFPVKGNSKLAWHVEYEDGDKEDLHKEELLNLSIEADSHGAAQPTYHYQKAKHELCSLMGVDEDEAKAALDQRSPPYKLNDLMQLIHKAKDGPASYRVERAGKFIPAIGLEVRKTFSGRVYKGIVTGKQGQFWRVTYNDGDSEDMEFNDLLTWYAGRPTRPHPVRGRQLSFVELFAGCCVVTEAFVQSQWRARSIDNSMLSNATDVLDFMEMKFKDIDTVPDFIWASLPCNTYSRLAGTMHRVPKLGHYEKTDEANRNNSLLTRLVYFLHWARKHNPHAIACIENPVGLLKDMPLMKELIESFGLISVVVDYCAFGRDDKKPTNLWTNDHTLASALSEFTCEKKCPHFGGRHPIGVRDHGHLYNAAAIPRALAEEVAANVNSTFYQRRIRYTKKPKLTQQEEDAFDKAMSGGMLCGSVSQCL